MHFSFRNQFCLLEGLRPTPGVKQTMENTENQFDEDIMGPTSEVVETPTQFEYASGYGQMGYEQPTSHIFPTEEIMSDEYDTWPAATWVPIPQIENESNEDVMGPTSGVLEPPAHFTYSMSYVQMGYEQLASQIMSPEYDTCPAGSWVPIPETENQFNEYVMGPTSEVVEPPVQFQYARGYGQMDTWVPTLHRDNPFCRNSVGQMPPGYLQYPPQPQWMIPYQW